MSDDKKLWRGLALTWGPWLVVIVPVVFNMFRGIREQKATGLGAVAGGIVEVLVTWGLLSLVLCEVGGMVLLAKSVRGGDRLRAVLAVMSLVFAALALVLVGGWVMLLRRAG
jgi:hypothetical protein